MDPNQLILACEADQIDNHTLKFTEPTFYVKNVHLQCKNSQKIRQLMQEMDLSLLPENIENESNFGLSSQKQESMDFQPSSTGMMDQELNNIELPASKKYID